MQRSFYHLQLTTTKKKKKTSRYHLSSVPLTICKNTIFAVNDYEYENENFLSYFKLKAPKHVWYTFPTSNNFFSSELKWISLNRAVAIHWKRPLIVEWWCCLSFRKIYISFNAPEKKYINLLLLLRVCYQRIEYSVRLVNLQNSINKYIETLNPHINKSSICFLLRHHFNKQNKNK